MPEALTDERLQVALQDAIPGASSSLDFSITAG
jgi:hypothetical protein